MVDESFLFERFRELLLLCLSYLDSNYLNVNMSENGGGELFFFKRKDLLGKFVWFLFLLNF